jgi:hypothetical protein
MTDIKEEFASFIAEKLKQTTGNLDGTKVAEQFIDSKEFKAYLDSSIAAAKEMAPLRAEMGKLTADKMPEKERTNKLQMIQQQYQDITKKTGVDGARHALVEAIHIGADTRGYNAPAELAKRKERSAALDLLSDFVEQKSDEAATNAANMNRALEQYKSDRTPGTAAPMKPKQPGKGQSAAR